MSAFNVSQYFQLLRQQVMSPGAMESQYSVILDGENFDNWYRRLSKVISAFRIEFFEYFSNDGIVFSIPPEIQANEIYKQSVLNILDAAMETAILTSSTPVIREVIRDHISQHEEISALGIMKFLKNTYGTKKVNTNAKLFNQVKDIFDKPLDDKKKWVSKVIRLIISQTTTTNLASYESDIDRKAAIIKLQDNFEALALIAVCPEYQALCLTHLGRSEMINVKDVVSLISANSNSTQTTMIAASKGNQTGKRQQKPKCSACNQRHYLKDCPEFKKFFPNSPILKKSLNVTKNDSSDTRIKTNSTNIQHGWAASTSTNIKRDDWIFDSGSTIQICYFLRRKRL